MTSGSLFDKDGTGWTGAPDGCSSSSALSTPCTASDVFRLNTTEHDFGNVTVSLDLLNYVAHVLDTTPAVDWDGVHVWLRYQSEYNLYYASFNRRDGHIVIKKKCPGGDENGGTYYELGKGEVSGYPIPFGTWQHLSASVQNTGVKRGHDHHVPGRHPAPAGHRHRHGLLRRSPHPAPSASVATTTTSSSTTSPSPRTDAA